MLDIKFRGKRTKNGEWVYGYLVKTNIYTYIVPEDQGLEIQMIPVKPDTVGQYTGVKDKNGKEIYESDIIGAFDSEIKAKVIYELCGFEFEWITKRTAAIRNRKSEPMFSNTSIIFEVIGNIYENAELISS